MQLLAAPTPGPPGGRRKSSAAPTPRPPSDRRGTTVVRNGRHAACGARVFTVQIGRGYICSRLAELPVVDCIAPHRLPAAPLRQSRRRTLPDENHGGSRSRGIGNGARWRSAELKKRHGCAQVRLRARRPRRPLAANPQRRPRSSKGGMEAPEAGCGRHDLAVYWLQNPGGVWRRRRVVAEEEGGSSVAVAGAKARLLVTATRRPMRWSSGGLARLPQTLPFSMAAAGLWSSSWHGRRRCDGGCGERGGAMEWVEPSIVESLKKLILRNRGSTSQKSLCSAAIQSGERTRFFPKASLRGARFRHRSDPKPATVEPPSPRLHRRPPSSPPGPPPPRRSASALLRRQVATSARVDPEPSSHRRPLQPPPMRGSPLLLVRRPAAASGRPCCFIAPSPRVSSAMLRPAPPTARSRECGLGSPAASATSRPRAPIAASTAPNSNRRRPPHLALDLSRHRRGLTSLPPTLPAASVTRLNCSGGEPPAALHLWPSFLRLEPPVIVDLSWLLDPSSRRCSAAPHA
nr:serine/arginine repetitive matrix protein 1 [Aegilops tauschii subsp. strangulata]